MRVYKSRFRDPETGAQRDTSRWYVDFLDSQRIRRRMPVDQRCRTERDAERFGQNVEQLVIVASHSERPDARLDTWLRSLSRATLKRLVRFGLADEKYATVAVPLSRHIADFEQYLSTAPSTRFGRRRCPKYIALTIKQLHTIMDAPECRFRFWPDVTRTKVEMFLGRLRESCTVRTCNSYIVTLQSFAKWMAATGRGEEGDVGRIGLLRGGTATERLALDAGDLAKLIEAAATGPVFGDMPGTERAIVYALAVELGFRVEELKSLQVGDFDLDAGKAYPFRTPAVRLGAEHTKNRQPAEQVLRRDRAEQLHSWLAGRAPEDLAFPHIPPSYRTSAMIRTDAKRAGIATKDAAGRVLVFHSLRHSLATLLDRAGIPLAVRMDITRHSKKSCITLGVYTQAASLLEKRDAVEKLPALPWPGQGNQAEPPETLEAVA